MRFQASGCGKNHWAILRHCNGMLKMSGGFSVGCHRGPSIIQNADLFTTAVDHGLDSQGHTRFQNHTLSRRAEIRYLWGFMQSTPDTMSNKFLYDTEPLIFNKFLNLVRNIRQSVTGPCQLEYPAPMIRGSHPSKPVSRHQPCRWVWLLRHHQKTLGTSPPKSMLRISPS